MFVLVYGLISRIVMRLILFCAEHNYRFVPFKMLKASKGTIGGNPRIYIDIVKNGGEVVYHEKGRLHDTIDILTMGYGYFVNKDDNGRVTSYEEYVKAAMDHIHKLSQLDSGEHMSRTEAIYETMNQIFRNDLSYNGKIPNGTAFCQAYEPILSKKIEDLSSMTDRMEKNDFEKYIKTKFPIWVNMLTMVLCDTYNDVTEYIGHMIETVTMLWVFIVSSGIVIIFSFLYLWGIFQLDLSIGSQTFLTFLWIAANLIPMSDCLSTIIKMLSDPINCYRYISLQYSDNQNYEGNYYDIKVKIF